MASRQFTASEETVDFDESLQFSRTVPDQTMPAASDSTSAASASTSAANTSAPGTSASSASPIPAGTSASSASPIPDAGISITGVSSVGRPVTTATSSPVITSPTADDDDNGDVQVSSWRSDLVHEKLDIITRRPKHQHMAVPIRRINTYSRWPHKNTHPAIEMAKAGFYYTGKEDKVRCFYCGVSPEGWTPSNEPWVEHCSWIPCPFVKLNKGQSYVDAVQKLMRDFDFNEYKEEDILLSICPCDPDPLFSETDVMREMNVMKKSKRKKSSQSAAAAAAMGVNMHGTQLREDRQEDVRREAELLENLEDEQKNKQNLGKCVCCQDEEMNVLFLPCGHIFCAQCAPALEKCAMCRKPVEGLARISLD